MTENARRPPPVIIRRSVSPVRIRQKSLDFAGNACSPRRRERKCLSIKVAAQPRYEGTETQDVRVPGECMECRETAFVHRVAERVPWASAKGRCRLLSARPPATLRLLHTRHGLARRLCRVHHRHPQDHRRGRQCHFQACAVAAGGRRIRPCVSDA